MLMRAISFAVIAAAVLGAALLGAGPGVRLGLWDYETAFKIFRVTTLPGFVFAGLALVGAVIAFLRKRRGFGVVALLAAALPVAGGYVPAKMRELAAANPLIHDITTDFDEPPQIIAGADRPRKNPAAYVGEEEKVRGLDKTVAQAQRDAFGDLGPVTLSIPLEEAREKATAVITSMGMEIIAEGPVGADSGSGWRIEAVATSTFFGFKDDFIVRLRPLESGQTRIDMRSKSRVGLSDLGVNAIRVRTFTAALNA